MGDLGRLELWTLTVVFLGDLTFGLGDLGCLKWWTSTAGFLFAYLLSLGLLGCLGCRLCTSLLYLDQISGDLLADLP